MNENYSTLIVEKDSLFREGLKLLLEQTEFSPTTCSLECDMAQTGPTPEILIVFAHEKSELGAKITRFRERFPEARIVILAVESDFDILNAAIHAGANAILLTSISAEGLIKSLKAVVADNIFVMDARILPSASGTAADWCLTSSVAAETQLGMRGLSRREVEILQRVVVGDSNKHIARFLDIAEATVKAHIKTILRKIGATNRTQAAIWAMQQGIDQPEQPASPEPPLRIAGVDIAGQQEESPAHVMQGDAPEPVTVEKIIQPLRTPMSAHSNRSGNGAIPSGSFTLHRQGMT